MALVGPYIYLSQLCTDSRGEIGIRSFDCDEQNRNGENGTYTLLEEKCRDDYVHPVYGHVVWVISYMQVDLHWNQIYFSP